MVDNYFSITNLYPINAATIAPPTKKIGEDRIPRLVVAADATPPRPLKRPVMPENALPAVLKIPENTFVTALPAPLNTLPIGPGRTEPRPLKRNAILLLLLYCF